MTPSPASRAPRRELTAETKVRLLLEVSQSIRGTLDLDTILDRLLVSLCGLVQCDACGIFVLSQDMAPSYRGEPGQVIAGVARFGYDERAAGRDPMLFQGAGITGHAIRTGEVRIVPDVRLDPLYVVGRATTLSEIAVPIRRNGHAMGALNLESDRLDAFGERELDVLTFFAEIAGIAIERATLHERLLEGERIEAQVRLAEEVQSRLLPAGPPDVPGYEFAGLCLPTQRIGGDYYDTMALPGERQALVVADVAGKGIAAALVMAAFRALLRDHLARGLDLAEVVPAVNRRLPESLAGAAFVTAFLAVLEPATGRLRYINAGHNPPFVVRSCAARAVGEPGRVEWLDRGGTVLGPFADAAFEVGEAWLGPGDGLVLYTDGVVESADQARRDFGAERLAQVAARLAHLPPDRLLAEIIRLTREFSGAVEFDDDFTLLVLRRAAAASTA